VTKVVDGHLHLFRGESSRYPRTVYPVMAEADREELAEKLLAQMAGAGVDHAIVVPLSRHDDYLRDVLRDHPSRFAGVGVYDLDAPDGVDGVKRRLDACDLQGLRFFGIGAKPGSQPEDLAVLPVLELMADRGLVMWFYGDEVQVAALDLVLRRLPRLRVVMNHLGFLPDIHAEMQVDEFVRPHFDVDLPPAGLPIVERLAAEHEHVCVHFSGHYAFTKRPYPYDDLAEVGVRLLAAFGAHRMIMASDWPWIELEPGYGRVLEVVDRHLPNLTVEERSMIRGGTALRLFRF
jgi:predicted TIM-barrel fold metal-dependent hydrolase